MVKVRVDSEQHKRWLRKGMLIFISNHLKEINAKLKESIVAKSFDFFASSSSYPFISIGPSLALKEVYKLPSLYFKGYKDVILSLSSSAFAKKFVSNSSSQNDVKFLAMSRKPVYVEALFSRRPRITLNFSTITKPVGAQAPLLKLEEQENPKIPKKVYSLFEEELKAREAVEELYSLNYDSYYLSRILSAGVLGEKKKFVPTRWSITAIDSMLSKFNISLIKDFSEINNIFLYKNEHFYNKFVIIFLPGTFEFENFEAWAPKTTWASSSSFYITEEYENLKGRTTYPHSQAGAYYSVLFSTTEFLRKIRRQAKIIVFREVSEGYQIPLGVWHVRETVKNGLLKKPTILNSKDELYIFLKKILTLPFPLYLKKSKILGQRRIIDYY